MSEIPESGVNTRVNTPHREPLTGSRIDKS
jgi:hypothetical protein